MECMSNTPYGGTPAGPTPWMPPGFPSKGPSRVPVIVALVLALAALGLATAAFFRPVPKPEAVSAQYSEQQVADAKKNLCDAYAETNRAIQHAGGFTSEDPNQKYMLSMNVRLTFSTSAAYLFTVAKDHSAGPPELLDSIRHIATTYQRVVLAQTAEAPKEELDAIYGEIGSTDRLIEAACK